jgi:hypothetical protein
MNSLMNLSNIVTNKYIRIHKTEIQRFDEKSAVTFRQLKNNAQKGLLPKLICCCILWVEKDNTYQI